MILVSQQEHCFTSRHLLSLDDHPLGSYSGRWFGETREIALRGHRRFQFMSAGVFGTEFRLREMEAGRFVAQAARGGWFSTSWDLQLSMGPCVLRQESLFFPAKVVVQNSQTLMRVATLGMCQGGWQVSAMGDAAVEDLLLVGLVFQCLIGRANSGTAAAAS